MPSLSRQEKSMNPPGDLDLKTNPWGKCARMLAGLVVAIAVLVLAGWLTGRLGLARWGDVDFVPMAPSTALMTLLFSLGLMANSQEAASRLNRAVTIVAAIVVFGLSGLLLIQWVFDFDCGLEAIIAHSHLALRKFGGQPAGHMSPITAGGLLISSLALFILQLATSRRALLTWAAILALTTVAIGFVVSLGYAYGAPLFYDGSQIPIALPTGLSILLLGVGVLVAAGPSAWPMRRLVGPAVSARLMGYSCHRSCSSF